MTLTTNKATNVMKLIATCQAAGLPRSHYTLNPEGTILRVMDGGVVRPFACSSRCFPAQIDSAIREITNIAAKRLMRIERRSA